VAVERICQNNDCGNKFSCFPSQVKKGGGKYCSTRCQGVGRSLSKVRVTLACRQCGDEFLVKPYRKDTALYCSPSCRGKNCPNLPNSLHNRRGTFSGTWLGDDVTISGAHSRCKSLWGSASSHPCITCGNPARDWAYDGTDPEQKYDCRGSSRGNYQYYSPWPEFYMPLCVRCHKSRDCGLASFQLHQARLLMHDTGLTIDQIREKVVNGS